MRSNKLISMLAMAAVMVGCSQEELLTVDNQQLASNDLAKRPVIGQVEFGLGVESRMALKDGSSLNLAYQEGDKVGAALIDVARTETDSVAGIDFTALGGTKDYSDKKWSYSQYLLNVNKGSDSDPIYYTTAGLSAKDFYTTVEYISSNYPYTRNADGAFESEANLLEGNYMFYMPYNAAHLNRKPIEAVLPQVQDCSDDVMRETTWKDGEKIQASSTALSQFYAGTMAGFEGAPVLVGYKFLEAPKDGSLIKPVVEMNHLYAYPMITIKNDFNGYFYNNTNGKASATARATTTMTIDSIQVYYTTPATDPYFYKAPVNSANIAGQLEKDGLWEAEKLQTGAVTAEVLGTATNEAYTHTNTLNTDITKVAAANIPASNNRVTMVIGKELAAGASYSFHAILPAGNYGNGALNARIYATINGKRYVILNAKNTLNYVGSGATATLDNITSSAWTENNFSSARYTNIELVRGEHFPKAEINVDADGNKSRKAFAGEGLTISMASKAVKVSGNIVSYDGGTAFQLNETAAPSTNYGITSNEDFISWLNSYVGRGEAISEGATATSKRANWPAGKFAFAENNTVVINASLIKALINQTVDDADQLTQVAKLTLKSNLPIANDVKITEMTADSIYTFETLDADKVSYKINYDGQNLFNTTASELKAGINMITHSGSTPVELKTKSGQSNIVVITNGTGTGGLKVTSNTTNVSAIKVLGGTLTVDAACNAVVTAEAGTITIGANGSLTNANNYFKNITITNNSARTIAGTLSGVTVTAEYAAAWPTTAIPAASKINKVTINIATAGKIAIEQAQVNMFSGLTNVDVVLGDKITSIESNANVTLTNIKSITALAANVKWISANNGVIITKYKWGTGDNDYTDLSTITADAGIQYQ